MAKSDKEKAEVRQARAEARDARREAAAAHAELAKERAMALAAKPASHLQGFMTFVRQQGVIGLAIGLAIGAQAGATVKSIVEGFINPIVAFLVGSTESLNNAMWHLIGKDNNEVDYMMTMGERTLVFAWGQVLSSIITLLAVAAVIYYVVKGLKLDKIDKPKA